uniref:Uncharacterized protein n=1 Tax=Kwi virus TaxID=2081616 RepID=A0A2L1CD26_9VIRU|nr:hypothetical protein [Kwi virus]
MSSLKQKSTIPVRHGFPNPCYGQALDLVRNVSQYRELAMRIRAEASVMRRQGGVDIKALMQRCADNGVKEQLRTLFVQHQEVPSEKPVLGAPPTTNELYGRFGHGLSIVDVGSGNCSKLTRYTGRLKIMAIDPSLANDSRSVLKQFRGSLMEFHASPDYHLEIIFTSFMSLCQIQYQEREFLVDHDGLHVVPDHNVLIHNRIALVREDGAIKVRTSSGDYIDNPVEMVGASLEPGYLLCPTFKARSLVVTLGVDSSYQDYKPVIDARPGGFYDLNFSDMGYKFDGEAYELECNEGAAYLVNRAGKQYIGEVNVNFQFCIHLERLAGCYVLIRLVSWRGYIPPHSGDCLRYFIERVSIVINGAPVLSSPRWDGASVNQGPLLTWDGAGGERITYRPDVDGVISRSEGFDMYCKYMWTIDIQEKELAAIENALAAVGFLLKCDGAWSTGLNECAMSRNGAEVHIRPLKPRVDKLVGTSLDTITFLVDKPTLAEHTVLTGSPATV